MQSEQRLPAGLLDNHVFVLSRTGIAARRLLGDRLGAAGLDRWQVAVLTTLDETGAVSQRQIAARLGVDPSDIVDVMTALETGGLLRRQRDPGDRRRYQVSLTAAGEQALARIAQVTAEAEAEVFAPLDDTERRELHRLLRRLLAHLDPRAAG